MVRPIDADALKEKYTMVTKRYGGGIMERPAVLLETIDEAPTINIVRCVECRYKGMEICPMYKLTKAGVLKPYDFCSYGEREGE